MILRKIVNVNELQTGDILHSQNYGPVGLGIGIGTGFWKLITGKRLPTHTAMVVRQNGQIQVYESNFGEGVHSDNIESWLRDNKRSWYTPVEATGLRRELGNIARAMEGLDYERVIEMFGIPFERNDKDEKRVFCTEYVYRMYLHVTNGAWACQCVKDPENISPAKFAFKVLPHWPLREA